MLMLKFTDAFTNIFIYDYFSAEMEGPEVTFLFQFGNIRDMVVVPASALTLKLLKDRACDFINTKVNIAKLKGLSIEIFAS